MPDSKPASDAPLRVLMAPDYRKDNPYQAMYQEALEERGIVVDFLKGYRRGFPFLRGMRDLKQNYDVFHLHWLNPYLRGNNNLTFFIYGLRLFFELLVMRLLGKKIIWTIHNLESHESKYPRTERWINRMVAKVAHTLVAHNQSTKLAVAGLYKVPLQKVRVMPLGHYRSLYKDVAPDTSTRNRLGIAEDSLLFIHLGLIRPYKGIDTLINAWRTLPDSFHENTHLLIIGKPNSDDYAAELRALINDDKTITLIPKFITEGELSQYFSAADFSVFPFKKVTTSSSVILAMTFDVPPIVPLIPQFEELLGEDYPLFYSSGDEAELAHVILNAKKHDHSSLAKEVHSRCDKLGWESIAEKTEKIYRGIDDPEN